MNPYTLPGGVELIVTGMFFGFGFAIGSWLWGALVGLVNRPKQ